ncbi:uncharacterized protein LOC118565877 isoform X1 [Fundulus heteroclitus]|uniref:uncharacterized protein LOC118565877 isoform X1 n=2 Tax=Fundulus heteroclitus TaxID=8078 RepID=UPI00165B66F3|nr:uncharacterized protein LOC118565877 isoform X1 [Fundulus heteroclitus]
MVEWRLCNGVQIATVATPHLQSSTHLDNALGEVPSGEHKNTALSLLIHFDFVHLHIFHISVMAAVMCVRNGRGGRTRTTKGLLLICTLFSLVCFTRSHFDKEQLKQFKDNVQHLRKQLQNVKDNLKTTIELSSQKVEYYSEILDSLTEMKKDYENRLPDYLLPSDDNLNNVKSTLEKTKADIKMNTLDLGKQIEDLEEKIGQQELLIKLIEDMQAEL